MFGKSKLKKIISMLNSLTDEELEELISAAEEQKDDGSENDAPPADDVETPTAGGDAPTEEPTEEPAAAPDGDGEPDPGFEEDKDEPIEEEEVEDPTAPVEEAPAEETPVEEEAPTTDESDIRASIKALNETVEALAARLDAMDEANEAERNDFEFGLAGKDEGKENKPNTLDEIKDKYWSL